MNDGIEGYKGKTVTFSVFIGGKVYRCTGVVPAGAFPDGTTSLAGYWFSGGEGNIHIFAQSAAGIERILIVSAINAGYSLTFEYAKFEKGDAATPLKIEDPAIKLIRCKRLYEVVLKSPEGSYDYLLGVTFWKNDNPPADRFMVGVLIKFTVEKRIPPILMWGGTFRIVCSAFFGGTVLAILVGDQVDLIYNSKDKAYVYISGTGTIPSGTTFIQIDTFENDGWIAFDASN